MSKTPYAAMLCSCLLTLLGPACGVSMTLPLPASYVGPLRNPHTCHCFSLCNETEVRQFRSRLPVVYHAGSPWHGYLHVIYGDQLRLPYDTSTLQLFYGALLPPLRLGSQCSQPLRPCDTSQARCADWVVAAAENKAVSQVERQGARALRGRPIRNRTHTAFTLVTMWERSPAESIQVMERNDPIPDHSWAEVLRRTASPRGGGGACPGEGVAYGCWFMLVRGSGVFVNVKRTRVVPSNAVLTTYRGGASRDCTFASNETAQMGFDSLQVLWGERTGHELLVATPSCMLQPRVLPGPCVPLPLQRGGHPTAERCFCNNSFAFLNCAGCMPEYPMASPRIPWSSRVLPRGYSAEATRPGPSNGDVLLPRGPKETWGDLAPMDVSMFSAGERINMGMSDCAAEGEAHVGDNDHGGHFIKTPNYH
uniref:Uncharacterized protein n=1 Tax=Haptolina ericina TaxID=156174 RepID=A0A7S3AI47_9EUKA